MTKSTLTLAVALVAASSAFGQIDEFNLRAKYGVPLVRETIMVRPGVEMVVDFGPSRQVCRISLPSGTRYVGTVPPGVISKQQIDKVLEEVLPPSIRGKEVNRMLMATGAPVVTVIEYEHVSIRELKDGDIGRGDHCDLQRSHLSKGGGTMTKFTIGLICCLGSVSSTLAQIDASALRSKYGDPVDRETFIVRPGIEMTVDYGTNKQVCKLQFPLAIEVGSTVPPGVVTKQQVDAVLGELVPPSMRGKEGRKMTLTGPGSSTSSIEYEHLTISEYQERARAGVEISVTFKDPACPKPTIQ